jgi:hypothetical protein
VDLNCGAGHLLQASALVDTELLLGCDIDPARHKIEGLANPRPISRLACDLTRLYPLLKEISFSADLFVLNPPWRLWWYRDRLAALAKSGLPAVREAFAQMEATAPGQDTIDSTIATLLMALDLCSHVGEGMLIANNATLERLIFAPNAPHAAAARHIWAHLVIPGNAVSGSVTCNWAAADFYTGVIYFAAGHESGPKRYRWTNPTDGPLPDRVFRHGSELMLPAHACQSLRDDWQAIKGRLAELDGRSPPTPFHLWLDAAGRIQCNLSRFEEKSVKLNQQEAGRLFRLRGRMPMELVLQRAQRDELLHVAHEGGWRVAPDLLAAVNRAVADYHRARAPLYPLPEIQRLGYLDEEDDIVCRKKLAGSNDARYLAGKRYVLHSTTVSIRRLGARMNNIGLLDDVEWNGQELAFFITDEAGVERCFMEGRNRDANVTVNLIKPGARHRGHRRRERDLEPQAQVIDFTLQELVEHFVIPEVPDVAALHPEQFQAHRQSMLDIARLTGEGRPSTGFEFKQFQLDDYARAALHDGVILGHDTGLGKTIAMFIWPLLKCGYVLADGHLLRPAKPVLLVVPGDGHDQTEEEYVRHFVQSAVGNRNSAITRLDSQATFLKLAKPDPRTGCLALEPNYYLTSYTQLTGNGVADFPTLDRANPERTMAQLNLREVDAIEWWNQRGTIYRRHYERLKIGPDSSWQDIEAAFEQIRRTCDQVVTGSAQESLRVLEQVTPLPGAKPAGQRDVASSESGFKCVQSGKRFNPAAARTQNPASNIGSAWEMLNAEQQHFVRSELTITRHREFCQGIGEMRNVNGKTENGGLKMGPIFSSECAIPAQNQMRLQPFTRRLVRGFIQRLRH